MKKVGDWCKEHWKEICLVIEIVAAVVCLLIPGLEGIGIGILAGMLIGGLSGAAIGGLSGYAQYGVDGILPGIINGTEDGMLIGGLFGGLGGIGAIAGEAFGCSALMTNVFSISSKLGLGMMAFDMTALANDFQNRFFQDTGINLGIIDPNIGEFISDLNHKAHSNPIYNAFQYAVAGTAAFSGSYVKTATCFVAGTLVATANGLAAIETIKAGDYVLSTDSDTMQTTYKPVLETYIRKVDRLVHLIISGEEIITTVDHPFYVQGRGFIEAGNLLVGDKLVSAIGEDLLIENYNIEETENLVDVYNFQVEDFHTYHVGDCAVWVHNANYLTDKTPKDISEMTRKQLKENTPEDWDFQEHNGRIHIKDDNGNYRVRVDVPDKYTPYNHIHILDENGNPLDANGNIVSPKDPAGHIPYNY